jgi:hypothetical protein
MRAWVIHLSGGPLTGRALHGWLFERLAARDRVLADRLHRPDRPRPFSWAVLDPPTAAGWPGAVAVRLAVFGAELEALATRPGADLLPEVGRVVTVYGRRRDVLRVIGPDEPHPWTGRADYADLAAGPAQRCVEVELATPTAFRIGDDDLAQPVPVRMVSSWARAWSAFSEAALPGGAVGELRGSLLLERAETQRSPRRERPAGLTGLTGFTGRVRLALPPWASDSAGVALSALSRLAFFCGTGRKTAMGHGLTRLVPGAE